MFSLLITSIDTFYQIIQLLKYQETDAVVERVEAGAFYRFVPFIGLTGRGLNQILARQKINLGSLVLNITLAS